MARIDVLRYASARRSGAVNVAVLACRAFAAPAPIERQTWRVHLGAHGARAVCEFPDARLAYDRQAFASDPRIARLVWDR